MRVRHGVRFFLTEEPDAVPPGLYPFLPPSSPEAEKVNEALVEIETESER